MLTLDNSQVDQFGLSLGFPERAIDCTQGFLRPHDVRVVDPHVEVPQWFREAILPPVAGPNDSVPIVYFYGGKVLFGLARLGITAENTDAKDYVRLVEPRSYRRSAIIPARYIDIGVNLDSDVRGTARLGAKHSSDNIFLGCLYKPDRYGNAGEVALLVNASDSVLAPYSDCEPVVIPPHCSIEFLNAQYAPDANRDPKRSGRQDCRIELLDNRGQQMRVLADPGRRAYGDRRF